MNAQVFEELRQQSRAHLDAALKIVDEMLLAAPDDAESAFLKSRCLLGKARRGLRMDGGADPAAEAVALLRGLVDAHPDNDAYRFELVDALMPRVRSRASSQPASPAGGAASPFDPVRAVAEARVLVAKSPDHVEYQAALARALGVLGARKHEAEQQKDPRAGIAELEEALAVHAAIRSAASPQEPRFVLEQVQTMRRLLRAKFDAGDLEGARTLGREAASILGAAARDGAFPPLGEERLEDLPQMLERLGLPDSARELIEADRRRR